MNIKKRLNKINESLKHHQMMLEKQKISLKSREELIKLYQQEIKALSST